MVQGEGPQGRPGGAGGGGGEAGRKRPPAEPGAGGSFAVLADELPDEGALRDQLGTDGEEVAVAFQQALHRLTVLAGVLDLLQQTGNDSGVQKRLVVVAGIDEDIGGAAAGLHVQQLAAQHILPHLHGAQRWGAAVQVIPDDAAGQAKVAGIQQGVAILIHIAGIGVDVDAEIAAGKALPQLRLEGMDALEDGSAGPR